jgi:putative transposase
MKDLYNHCQITKQGHYQALKREQEWQIKERLYIGFIMQIREIHPAMGLRTMYEYYSPEGIGRDAFISIGIYYGFRTKVFRNLTRTTFSSPYSRYKNLLVDKKLNNINQLWTSDLTYFKVGETFYYIVFIMDVYSRVIVGYSVADNMRAENNVIALKMAFKYRNCTKFNYQLTHHSDRGGQYISEQYIALLNDAQIQISMCNEVYENAHIERVNGIIKNIYLQYWNIANFGQLQKQLKKAVDTYNNCKPHSAIGDKTPWAFEQYIKELNDENKPKLSIWTCDLSKKQNPNQCLIQF